MLIALFCKTAPLAASVFLMLDEFELPKMFKLGFISKDDCHGINKSRFQPVVISICRRGMNTETAAENPSYTEFNSYQKFWNNIKCMLDICLFIFFNYLCICQMEEYTRCIFFTFPIQADCTHNYNIIIQIY